MQTPVGKLTRCCCDSRSRRFVVQDEVTTVPAQNAVTEPPPPEQGHQPPSQQRANEHAADLHLQESPAAAEGAGGGWVQASTASSARQAPLSNIKFSLKL